MRLLKDQNQADGLAGEASERGRDATPERSLARALRFSPKANEMAQVARQTRGVLDYLGPGSFIFLSSASV